MNKNETNGIIEATLNSVNSIKRSVPDDVLFQKIMNDINQVENNFIKQYSNTGKFVFAFAVFIFLNVFSLINFQKKVDSNSVKNSQNFSTGINEFSKAFFSATDEYNYDK